jgi:hypothetical protein
MKDFLSEILEQPDHISEENIARLEELKKSYPYCESFKTLSLIGSYKINDGTFHSKLNQDALQLKDRKNLYYLTLGSKVIGIHNLINDSEISNSKTKELEDQQGKELAKFPGASGCS